MNETFKNLLQQNRAKKVYGKKARGKKTLSGMVVNEEIPQEELQTGPSRQCMNLAEP